MQYRLAIFVFCRDIILKNHVGNGRWVNGCVYGIGWGGSHVVDCRPKSARGALERTSVAAWRVMGPPVDGCAIEVRREVFHVP